MKAKKMNLGVVGLVCVSLGTICRAYLVWINPIRGGIQYAETVQMLTGAVSLVLLLVGGVVSFLGLATKSGAMAGLIGVVVTAIIVIRFLASVHAI